MGVKSLLKRAFEYRPLPETAKVREAIAAARRPAAPRLPFLPTYQGDFFHRVIRERGLSRGLEVGFATGSSAAYMLNAMEPAGGTVTSIDYKQADFDYMGVELVQGMGGSARHTLLEGNSNRILPELLTQGHRFDFVFLDGWKTFDHLLLDVYYCNEMLDVGGVMVFDDARMPSVRKVNRLLERYYEYREMDYRAFGEDLRLRVWYVLNSGGHKVSRPFRAFAKERDTAELTVRNDWNFFRDF